MSKYDPLGHFLARNRHSEIPMTFEEIEKVLGFSLPERSKHQRPWWSNNPNNNVMTKVWLDAGFQTERVDVAGRRLVFKRVVQTPVARPDDPGGDLKGLKPRRHPGFGLMKGLTTIAPGTDLTAPTGGDWGRSE